jgi:hypothetical protein
MPNPGHEMTDVNTKWIARVLIFLAVGGVAVQLICGGLFLSLRKFEGPSRMNPLKGPPKPRLEIQATGVEELRTEDQKVLDSYGWVNQKAGVVRIPITRAMERLADVQK